MIVADTSAVLALLDADDEHHDALRELWEQSPDTWLIPWATLPEIDHLARRYLGAETARLFLDDVGAGVFIVEHGAPVDVLRGAALDARYAALDAGLVDGVVVAVAERVRATGIATLDLRHFSVLAGELALYPRDL